MAKELNRYLTKEDTQMVNNTWKDAQDHTSLGNCELKQRRDATYTVCWNGWNPKAWQYQMLAKMQRGRNSFTAGKNAKWCGHFGRQFGRVFWFFFFLFSSHNLNIALCSTKLNIRFSNHAPSYPVDLKTYVYPKSLIMFTTALFITTKTSRNNRSFDG